MTDAPKKISAFRTRYTRADLAQAQIGAALEMAAQLFQDRGDRGLGAPYRAPDRIRALKPDAMQALEQVKAEAREQALREAVGAIQPLTGTEARDAGAIDAGEGYDLAIDDASNAILALIEKDRGDADTD